MRQMAVVSGKGGTGKTTITSALARLWENKVLVDCDVDAANLHLLFTIRNKESHDFYSGSKAEFNHTLCNYCGECRKVCRFAAIDREYQVDDLSCIGCGACALVCPEGAVQLKENLAGKWFVSDTRYGPMVHAALGIAEDNSGKLVTQIRSAASNMAAEKGLETILIDGPPGIGCPVIASISGTDMVLAVTEPTLSGLHDLERIITLAGKFNIKSLVCINKHDLNRSMTERITVFCREKKLGIAGMVPFDRGIVQAVVDASVQGTDFFSALPLHVKKSLEEIYQFIKKEIAE